MKIRNIFISRLKNSIFLNSYALNKESAKFKIILSHIILILLFSLVMGIPIFIFLNFEFGLEIAGKYSPFSIIFGLGMEFILKPIFKRMEVFEDNNFFVDPISNTAIEKYVAKLSKRKKFIIHISELDRLADEVGEGSEELIRYIVESIALAYKAKNIDIIFEINKKIKDITSKNSIGVYLNKDKANKMFDKIVKIRSFNLESIIDYKNMSHAQKELFRNYYIALTEISNEYRIHIASWRLLDRHWEIFNKVNQTIFENMDLEELIPNETELNDGFEDIYKAEMLYEFSIDQRNKGETKVEIDGKIKIIYGLDASKDKGFWNSVFLFTNPHIYIPKKNFYFPDLTSQNQFKEVFINTYIQKLVNKNIMKHTYLVYIIWWMDPIYIEKISHKINFSTFWEEEMPNIKTENKSVDKKEFFNKMPTKVKEKIFSFIKSKDIKEYPWTQDETIKYMDQLSNEVVKYIIKEGIFNIKTYIANEKVKIVAQFFSLLTEADKKEFIHEINDTNFKDRRLIFKKDKRSLVKEHDLINFEKKFLKSTEEVSDNSLEIKGNRIWQQIKSQPKSLKVKKQNKK